MPEETETKMDTTLSARPTPPKTNSKPGKNQAYIKLCDLPAICETDPAVLILRRYGHNGLLPNGDRQPRPTFLKFADRRASAANGATAYRCTKHIHQSGAAKNGGINPDDSTSFHPGQFDVCDCCNPPDIHYQALRKPDGSDDVPKAWDLPPIICTNDGIEICIPIEDKVQYDDHGKPIQNSDGDFAIERLEDESGNVLNHPLYDFEILPLRISRAEAPWMLEMWLRLDPRIRWADIAVRMKHGDGGRRPTRNTMNMACVRLRRRSGLKDWGRGRKHPKLSTDTNADVARIDVKMPALENGWNPFGPVKRAKAAGKRQRKHQDGSARGDVDESEDEKTSGGLASSTKKRQKRGENESNSPNAQNRDLTEYRRSPPVTGGLCAFPRQNQSAQYHNLPGKYEVPFFGKAQKEAERHPGTPVIGRNQLLQLKSTLLLSLYSHNRFPTPEDVEEAHSLIPAAFRHSILHLHDLQPDSTIDVELSRGLVGPDSKHPPAASNERSLPLRVKYRITVEDQPLPKWLLDYYQALARKTFA